MNGRCTIRALTAAGFFAAMPVCGVQAQGTGQPAELPPADYAGLQYVDSQGCVFMRAGTEAGLLWVPRVTPGGKQLCGYPPSGNRVPVEGEPGADQGAATQDAESSAVTEAVVEPEAAVPEVKQVEVASAPAAEPAETGSYVVAIGSFGFSSNVTKAVAAADALGYPVVTGQLSGGEQGLVTVFAGPFAQKSDATDALNRLQGAGYPDALLMTQ